jgi:hypothetical protein
MSEIDNDADDNNNFESKQRILMDGCLVNNVHTESRI